MMSEETVQSAMSIILNAGDARVACKEALDAIATGNFDEAEEKMEQAAESGDVNTGCDDFDHWDVMPGDYGRYPIPRDQEKLYRNHDAIN